MWDWIILLAVGALIGWIASIVLQRDEQQGAIGNIVVGIAGAFLARYLFGSIFSLESASQAGALSIPGILWGIAGSVLLLLIVQAVMKMVKGNNGGRGI